MSDYLADLRAAATDGVAAYARMLAVGEGVGALTRAERDALRDYDEAFGAEARTPVVLALIELAEAAGAIASDDYLQQPPPYATGITLEEAVALTEAVHRLRTLTGEDT